MSCQGLVPNDRMSFAPHPYSRLTDFVSCDALLELRDAPIALDYLSVAARQQTVLIVEDDVPLRRMFRQALTVAGYDVREAGDGLFALRQIEAQAPDLLVLDLGLPTLSGYAVQQEIAARPNLRHIPIVVVTGLNVRAKALDVSCVLPKPVTPDELVRVVGRCMGRSAPFSGAC